jgi:ribosomal protein L21
MRPKRKLEKQGHRQELTRVLSKILLIIKFKVGVSSHGRKVRVVKNGRDSNSQRLGVNLVVKKYELEIFYFVKEV